MPIITYSGTSTSPTPPKTETPASPTTRLVFRWSRLDNVAAELAPIIAEIRKAGYYSIAEIAYWLDKKGYVAPSGGCFTYETTRQILKHIKSLGLGEGPRTVSEAMLARGKKKTEMQTADFEEANHGSRGE